MKPVNRILFLGDSHGNSFYMKDAMKLAKGADCDVLFVAGDFGIWEHDPIGVKFLQDLNALAEETDKWVFFVDGNHENFDILYEYDVKEHGFREVRSRIWHAPRGHIWRWGPSYDLFGVPLEDGLATRRGVTFLAMGGAHSIDGPGGIWLQARGPGSGWWPQETITHKEVELALRKIRQARAAGHPIDVLVSHDTPYGYDIPQIRGGYPLGDENRKKLGQVFNVAKPQLVIHGHYHVRYTREFMGARIEGLAADGNRSGQWVIVDTDPFRLIPPKEERVRTASGIQTFELAKADHGQEEE